MRIIHLSEAEERRRVAREILTDLPEWFGIPESTEEYIRESARLPFFAAEENGRFIGFMAMKETSPHTCEIYVCGVKRVSSPWRRQSAVRKLSYSCAGEGLSISAGQDGGGGSLRGIRRHPHVL